MTERPAVSVIVPTRNRWQLLSRTALPSALAQEGVELEVVVVDDGSTDETPGRLAELTSTDTHVRVLSHDSSRGVAAARNTGIAVAEGRWVAFLDDDDVWSPRKLAAQLEAAMRVGTSWVYSGALAVSSAGDVLYEYYFPEPSIVADQLRRSAVVPAGASNVLARTTRVRDLGGFDERFSMLADWDFWIRLSETGRPAAVRDVHVAVLHHSRSGHAVTDQSGELELLIRKHGARAPSGPLQPDVRGHGRWVASEHSRAGLHRKAAWLYARDAWRHRSPTNGLRAFDALLGKRIGSLVLSPRRGRVGGAALVAPTWLEQSPYFRGRV